MNWWPQAEGISTTRRWRRFSSRRRASRDARLRPSRSSGSVVGRAPAAVWLEREAFRRASVLAAVPLTRTAVGPHGIAVRPESALRLDAPVRGSVVLVVERELVGIGAGRDEHALVPQIQTVHARCQLRRS